MFISLFYSPKLGKKTILISGEEKSGSAVFFDRIDATPCSKNGQVQPDVLPPHLIHLIRHIQDKVITPGKRFFAHFMAGSGMWVANYNRHNSESIL